MNFASLPTDGATAITVGDQTVSKSEFNAELHDCGRHTSASWRSRAPMSLRAAEAMVEQAAWPSVLSISASSAPKAAASRAAAMLSA